MLTRSLSSVPEDDLRGLGGGTGSECSRACRSLSGARARRRSAQVTHRAARRLAGGPGSSIGRKARREVMFRGGRPGCRRAGCRWPARPPVAGPPFAQKDVFSRCRAVECETAESAHGPTARGGDVFGGDVFDGDGLTDVDGPSVISISEPTPTRFPNLRMRVQWGAWAFGPGAKRGTTPALDGAGRA